MPRIAPFGERLLRWYDRGHRDLPWRRTRDPWAIWVSEVMLQQTRVEAVRATYERFLRDYPDPRSWATASDDALMLAWKGLGYYRRARLLRDGARAVVERHGGAVPADAEAIGELPGVGSYTRGAIASIAFGLALPAVDGNVERVLARHLALREDVGTAAARRRIAATASEHLVPARAGDFNQAMMELGATVCAPRTPKCAECPVAQDCRGRLAGIASELPVKKAPRATVPVDARAVLVPVAGGVLAHRVPDGEPNAGQWELPGPGVLCSVDLADFTKLTMARCGAALELGPTLATVAHAITHHRISLTAHAGRLAGRTRGRLEAQRPDDESVPWTTPSRKVFAAVARSHGALDA